MPSSLAAHIERHTTGVLDQDHLIMEYLSCSPVQLPCLPRLAAGHHRHRHLHCWIHLHQLLLSQLHHQLMPEHTRTRLRDIESERNASTTGSTQIQRTLIVDRNRWYSGLLLNLQVTHHAGTSRQGDGWRRASSAQRTPITISTFIQGRGCTPEGITMHQSRCSMSCWCTRPEHQHFRNCAHTYTLA